jgi:hypothetical protein
VIVGEELQPVLERNGCDLNIVARNGAVLFSQIYIHLSIPEGGLFRHVQNAHRWFTQEWRQLPGVFRPRAPRPESAVQLAEHNG